MTIADELYLHQIISKLL